MTNILLHFLYQLLRRTQSQCLQGSLEEILFSFSYCSLSENPETLVHQLSIVRFYLTQKLKQSSFQPHHQNRHNSSWTSMASLGCFALTDMRTTFAIAIIFQYLQILFLLPQIPPATFPFALFLSREPSHVKTLHIVNTYALLFHI